jgi:DNA invertase Pin-like site-specific DNA recombinase
MRPVITLGNIRRSFLMTGHVSRRPASKRRATITADVESDVLALLGTVSQNQIARRLGISQSTVSRIARRQAKALPFLIISAAETEEA